MRLWFPPAQNFAVCESTSDWGASVCAACPNPSTVITGGGSSVLCVWDIALAKDKLQYMRLRQVGALFLCVKTYSTLYCVSYV